MLFEFIDDTYYKNIADQYNDTKTSVALIVFDNIEDFSSDAEQEAAAAARAKHEAAHNNAAGAPPSEETQQEDKQE